MDTVNDLIASGHLRITKPDGRVIEIEVPPEQFTTAPMGD